MNLVTAQDLLRADLDIQYVQNYEALKKAIKLGAEGLQFIKRLRSCSLQARQTPLPSEDPFIDTSRSEHAIKRIMESPLVRPDGD